MIALEVHAHGGPEALRIVELPVPRIGPDELLVRNRWIGVNWVDLQHVAGAPYPIDLPLIPGTEASGDVVAAGSSAPADLVGRPVIHFGHLCGVYAEYTAVPMRFVIPLAGSELLRDAAAVAINGTTAYVLVHDAVQVQAGHLVVVQAAAGGTGGAVVQLAKAAGAEVVGLASSRAKADTAGELGADHALALAGQPDAFAAILEATGGRRADFVFDGNGRDTFDLSLDLLATRGTLVLYGQSSGPVAPADPAVLSGLQRHPRRRGSLAIRWANAGGDFLGEHPARGSAMRHVLRALSDGRLSARVAQEFPLARAADAYRALAGRRISGKVLLRVTD
jgi:NADPH:quinone reductase